MVAPVAAARHNRPSILLWMLALVAVAVALGTYPIVRRLTKRLEALQHGVREWGDGDLARRLPDDGQDEVANLARGFNDAAASRAGTAAVTQGAAGQRITRAALAR
jgi:two-component system OmpR family sensor kinase